ncbi:MAG: NAD(P)/FAD-dependent oxidoreductase [Casimicrobiaceae bacterium]|nr:NAD(P)/FAD-dependent oxidoreductase [Casimicrobiaceae bacterium]MCX8098933.1 NAD(P)/FAD-dependent oxidoreductase [Casimicrobiaceae bacterium]MDW8312632.1 NAD(P)/FAD-dependent oxidoreductase [Burkholderiales bacterium]
MTTLTRRDFVKTSGTFALLGAGGLSGCAAIIGQAKPKVVVVGGGWGGATAAKYIAMWSNGAIDVTLIERNDVFISCPISNLVIGGSRNMDFITVPYSGLDKYGIRRIKGEVTGFDPSARTVSLADGTKLPYDRLILSPGIDFMYETLPGLATAEARSRVLAAWKAGPETLALRRQLEAMPDGGVYAIHIPRAPYRCPPGPYERACQVAWYFKTRKPRSKVVILDANEDVQSKKGLFTKAWNEDYKGIVEYRNNQEIQDVDARTNTVKFTFGGEFKADVLNVLPPMRCGDLAMQHGLNNSNRRWCLVDWLTFESTAVKNVHILGDSLQIAPGMPKSGHMANQHGKVCASAVIALLTDQPVNQNPVYANTCYSFIDDKNVVHVASVHRYDPAQKTMVTIQGSGGLSDRQNELEGIYAISWARNVWADMLT